MSANPPAPPTSQPGGWAGEAWGGFASMLVALPSSIAYGVAVYAALGADYIALGVRAGILGAIVLGLVAAAIGGSPRLISAPCAPAAAVLAALIGDWLGDAHGPAASERIIVVVMVVALFSGGLQTAYGLIGGGRLIKYIPYPVVAGYLSAVGVIIFLGQLPKFLGVAKGISLGRATVSPDLWQWPAVIVGATTIAGVLLAPRVTRRVPAPILGLMAGVA
ncbi:MAG: SulP family inorganic anion transporter, partial [Verrucomicrobia bacterium]|nr:SulP family inorganic anion transporter [Verrucomicrobiota bacterium]